MICIDTHSPYLYRLIVESAVDFAIFVLDKDGLISSWNCGAERIFQYKEHEILGESIAVIFTQDDQEKDIHTYEMTQSLAEGRASDVRWHVRKDKSRFWASGSIMPLFDDDKRHLGYLKIVQDRTDAKKVEEKITTLNEELDQKVQKRTFQLQQQAQQLQRLTRQLIETEEREKHQLAQILHDDHQQILVAIKIKIGRLKREEGSAQQEILDSIHQLLAEVLHKNRALSKELWNPALVHQGLIPGLEWLRKHMCSQYNLTLHMNATGPANQISSNSTKILLYQCIRELLMNVVKHAGVEEAYLDIHSQDDFLIIKVRDTGRGFDSVQAKDEKVETFGLFSIRERLNILNGTMDIVSEPGKGTSVELKIPQQSS